MRRRHAPPALDYTEYRDCLRWDFGFTCPFCLLHESDYCAGGTEKLAFFSIEHFRLKSVATKRRNDYSNCLLCCMRCNNSRGQKPNRDAEGRNLLDPTTVAWAEYFEIAQGDASYRWDEIRPRPGAGPDAEYTADAYDLADPRKSKLRFLRREDMTKLLKAIWLVATPVPRFAEIAERLDQVGSPTMARDILNACREALAMASKARIIMELRYQIVPDRAPVCQCSAPGNRELPPQLSSQTHTLPPL